MLTCPCAAAAQLQAKGGFTDQNARWLKPKGKQVAVDSDEPDSGDEGAAAAQPAKRAAGKRAVAKAPALGAKKGKARQPGEAGVVLEGAVRGSPGVRAPSGGAAGRLRAPAALRFGLPAERAFSTHPPTLPHPDPPTDSDGDMDDGSDSSGGYVDDGGDEDIGILGDEFGGGSSDDGSGSDGEGEEGSDDEDGAGGAGGALFDSDSGGDGSGGEDDLLAAASDEEEEDDDDGSDGDDEQLAIERHSKLLDKAAKRAAADAEAEAKAMAAGLDTNIEEVGRAQPARRAAQHVHAWSLRT